MSPRIPGSADLAAVGGTAAVGVTAAVTDGFDWDVEVTGTSATESEDPAGRFDGDAPPLSVVAEGDELGNVDGDPSDAICL